MRKVIPAVLLALFFIVGIPLVLGLFAGQEESKPEEDVFSGKVDTPETVSVWISGEGKAEEIDFEEYVAWCHRQRDAVDIRRRGSESSVSSGQNLRHG